MELKFHARKTRIHVVSALRMPRKFSISALAWLIPGGFTLAQEKVTFDDHILPIFQQSCLNCHNPDKTKGGLDLSTYTATLKGGSGGKIAEPGDVSSKLIGVVTHAVEPKMPPEGDKLGSAEIALLKSWIEGGLLENRTSSAKKPDKPKFDTALRSDPSAKPEGPPPMPEHVLLEPVITAPRASAVHALAASPWAPLLAVTGQKQVLLFDTRSLELCGILPFPEGDPVSLAFTPDGRYLITGGGTPGKSGVTVTFDIRTGGRVLTAAREFDSVLAADLRPDLTAVATGSPSKLVKIWRSDDGEQVHSIKKHTEWVTALDYSPDGILLATGDRNGGVWVWEADNGNEFHTLRAHQAAITAAIFRDDSNLLATASEDGTVRFWEMNGGSEVRKIDAHPGGVLAFAWGRDGGFATSGRDRSVKLWKPDFGMLREFKDLPDLPLAVALEAEGKMVFAADYRGVVTAWDASSGELIGSFDANPPSIADRLVTIRDELRRHPERLASAENAAREAKRKLAEGQQALEAAQKAVEKARKLRASTVKGREELEKRFEQVQLRHASCPDELSKARAAHDSARKAWDSKRNAIPVFDQRIESAIREHEEALAVEKRLEDEVSASRAGGGEALELAESALREHRDKLVTLAAALEEARSEKARQAAELAELAARMEEAEKEVARLESEWAAVQADMGKLPEAIRGAARTVSDAEAAIRRKEEKIAPLTEALSPLEHASKEAAAVVEAVKSERPVLEARERHWAAAEINAKAIATFERVREAESEAEAAVAEFQSLAVSLGELQIQSLRSDDPELAKRVAKTAVDFTEAKRRADELLPAVHALRAEADDLKARYLALVATAASEAPMD